MTTERIEQLPLGILVPSPTNPRRRMDDASLQELAASIRELGVQQPIVVRPAPADALGAAGGVAPWQIVFGHRRARAAELAGMEFVPAICRVMTDEQVALAQLAENIQREDMPALDEALAVLRLHEDLGLSPDAIAQQLGKSRSWAYGRIKIARASPAVHDAMAQRGLPADIALEVARLRDPALQKQALQRVRLGVDGWQSVRDAASIVRHMQRPLDLAVAPFALDAATLVPDAGSCTACPKRSGNDPDLAATLGTDSCTDPACYRNKATAWHESWLEALRAKGRRVLTAEEAAEVWPNPFARAYGYVDIDGITLIDEGAELSWRDAVAKLPGLDADAMVVHAIHPHTGELHQLITEADDDVVRKAWAERRRRQHQELVRRDVVSQADEPDDEDAEQGADWTPAERLTLQPDAWALVRQRVLQAAAAAQRTVDDLRLIMRDEVDYHDGEPWECALPVLGIEPHGDVDGNRGDWWRQQIQQLDGAQLAALMLIGVLDTALRPAPWMLRGHGHEYNRRARQRAADMVGLAQRYGIDPLQVSA